MRLRLRRFSRWHGIGLAVAVLAALMDRDRPNIEAAARQLAAARRDAGSAIEAEPVDAAAVRVALDRSRIRWNAFFDAFKVRLDDLAAVAASSDGSMLLPFNVTGDSAMAPHIGFDRDGLSSSLRIVGRAGGEEAICAAAAAYEGAEDHASRRSALAGGPG